VTALGVVRQMTTAAQGGGASEKLGVETIRGTDVPNQPAPRSDAPVATGDAAAERCGASCFANWGAGRAGDRRVESDGGGSNELKPNVEPDPAALPPLQQTNELEGGGTSSSSASGAPPKAEEMAEISSSQKKKKRD